MKLAVRIEPNQKGTLHSSLVAELNAAAQATDLDRAEAYLRGTLNAQWWLVGRGGHHVWVSMKTQYEPVRVAMIVEGRRHWDGDALTIEGAKQDQIERGDIVRAYDFPGMRDDVYVEGVVKTREADTVLIHVTRDVYEGRDLQVGDRFEVWSPLGVSSMSGAPCVFLIAKRVNRRGN